MSFILSPPSPPHRCPSLTAFPPIARKLRKKIPSDKTSASASATSLAVGVGLVETGEKALAQIFFYGFGANNGKRERERVCA